MEYPSWAGQSAQGIKHMETDTRTVPRIPQQQHVLVSSENLFSGLSVSRTTFIGENEAWRDGVSLGSSQWQNISLWAICLIILS